jgi:hypothetical protein
MAGETGLKGLEELLSKWKDGASRIKEAFLRLKRYLEGLSETKLSFKARPGVSYSLRAAHEKQRDRQLFVMVDIIDDDPSNRWLSVCFYRDMINDPDQRGDEVPGGLLGQDACCFDIDEWDEELLSYVEARIGEAHSRASK